MVLSGFISFAVLGIEPGASSMGSKCFPPGYIPSHSFILVTGFGGIFFFSNTPKMPNESILGLFEYNLNVYYLEITLEIVPFK